MKSSQTTSNYRPSSSKILLDKLRSESQSISNAKNKNYQSPSKALPVIGGLPNIPNPINTSQDFSLVLNLQPMVKSDSIFEVLTKRQGTIPNAIIIDHSPFLAIRNITDQFVDSVNKKFIARSLFSNSHGDDSGNNKRLDNVKAVYYKRTQSPMSFLSSQVHSVELIEESTDGIYKLEFKVLRDSTYDAIYLNALPNAEGNRPEDSFPEAKGYTSNINLLNDIVSKSNTVFQVSNQFIAGGTTYAKYQLDFDLITIIFYGCSVEIDFDKLYTSDQLFGTTKLNDIHDLISGYYITKLKDESNESYRVFDFDSNNLTMTDIENNEIYSYDFNLDAFELSGLKLDFDIKSINIDANGLIYQIDKRKDSDTRGKYIDNNLDEITDRENITEVTLDYAEYLIGSGTTGSDVNLMNSVKDSLKSEENIKFLKIKFNFAEAEFDNSGNMIKSGTLITDPSVIDNYRDQETEDYKYPSTQNPDITLTKKPFNIIYHQKIANENNSYLRDFVMISKMIDYFGIKTESEVGIIRQSENTSNAILFEECRTNPLLWSYLASIHESFREGGNYLPYTGNKPIDRMFTFAQFMKANYYDIIQTNRDNNEKLTQALYNGTGTKLPVIITSMPLK